MNIGILGSGVVGQSLASGFLQLGHSVKVGTRTPAKLNDWLKSAGKNASVGSFFDTAKFGELIVLCTKWEGTGDAITMAGRQNFAGKVVIDVTNPLLFQENQPPTMALGYPDSAGKAIQNILPDAKVVKAFNIVTAAYMCNPKLQEGTPDMFIAGNDIDAKNTVADFAKAWGWPVTDIGNIEQSYLLEALAMLWIRYGALNNHWTHAWKLLRN